MFRLAPLMFVVSILFVGCTAPAHLMHTSELDTRGENAADDSRVEGKTHFKGDSEMGITD